MSTQDFFCSKQTEDNVFFDEGPQISQKKITYVSGTFRNTSSIDTSQIDAYRQGVEITLFKHFDAGTVKIHAGEPGHVLRRNHFGMNKNFRQEPTFEEIDYFNPRTFLIAQDLLSPILFNTITFPIITSDNDQIENYVFDGIIEPLTIRARASFFSIDVPFEAHEVKGAVMGGNTDTTWASDCIETVYTKDLAENLPFLDQYADAVAFAEQEAGAGHSSTIVGYFRHDKAPLKPFVDERYPRNLLKNIVYDQEMDTAISMMTGSTDNYISSALKKKSAVCGWEFDNNIIGTDSLAFGGMTY